MMNYYLAPLEGITTYIFRNAYHEYFRPADKYFTPFIVPHTKKDFNSRELNEILPEHNKGMKLVPQILTNNADDFVRTANKICQYGYDEVNLNLGCPSKTVVSKYRGSGFLAKQGELDRFLDAVYEGLDMKVSIKTRIGKDDPDEFYELIQIYNKYPIEELIIHPRTQKDFYKNTPNLKIFGDAVKLSKNPLCYNGNLFTDKDMENFSAQFPDIDTVMLGRGIIMNPGLIEEMEGRGPVNLERIKKFHDKLYADYKEINFGERNVLFKMKELWGYMLHSFPGSQKCAKKIRKSEKFYQYEEAVDELFS